MPVKIDKKFYKETLEKYNALNAELNNGEHSQAAIIFAIEEKYNQIKNSNGIDRNKKENFPELVSLYLLAKDQETFIPNPALNDLITTMEDDLTIELPFFVPQLASLVELITLDEQIDPKHFNKVLPTGKVVLNDNEVQKKFDDAHNQRLKEDEERKKEESERLKEKEKNTYNINHVTPDAINEYLKIADKIYNGDLSSVKLGNKKEFSKQLTDDEISEKLRNNANPPLTVDNVIDRIAMYKAQKAKFDSLNGFKRFFSFLFSDARKLKSNLTALENSFSKNFPKEGIPATGFKNIVNSDNPALMIQEGAKKGIIEFKNEETKKLFENSSLDKKSLYMQQHPELIENDKDTIKALEKIDEIVELSKKKKIEIDEEELNSNLDKSFYDQESHIKGLEEAGKFDQIKEEMEL